VAIVTLVPYRAYEQQCSVASALELLGERWTLLIMRDVLLGSRHFNQLKRSLGVAPNILSDRLDTLVGHGLLERRADAEHPDSPTYHPTQAGIDVNPVLMTLMEWGDKHATPAGGPPRISVHTTCGHDAHAKLHCSHCGEEVLPRESAVRPGPGASERVRELGVLPRRAPEPAGS